MGHGKLVTVFGGSGFVGRHAVRALAQEGWRVRVAVRRPDLAGHVQPMGNVGQIHPVQANLRYPESVRAAVQGADAVVNLVGILAPAGRQTFEAVHVKGAGAVAQATADEGISRLVHVSALGADTRSSSNYAKSKARGEKAVRDAKEDSLILRPSIVFGPEDEFFNKFAGMFSVLPLVPLFGGGKTRFEPVFVGDLAEAIKNACGDAGAPGQDYEIGGPEIYSLRQVYEKTREWAGQKSSFVGMPYWIAKLMALATWPLPNSVRPITVDQIKMLQQDNLLSSAAIEEGRTIGALGINATQSVSAVVPGYLERFRPRGQFSHYRG